MRVLTCLLMLCFCMPVVADDLLDRADFKYENALKLHETSGKPLIVVCGAKWCGPCRLYKADTIKKLAQEFLNKRGKADFVLAIVDTDESADLANEIFGGEPFEIPYTAVYHQKERRVIKKSFTGRVTFKFVRDLLNKLN